MPVSHLGLTVSHIPSATSFYLAALQPLGYRFIGQQGRSIGLGVDSADFFLTQSPSGTRPSPNHIAFLAENRLVVRECYAAALNTGGTPSGSPNYRGDNCSCFNAAVEDLDGNTVEFIFRQPHGESECCDGVAAPENRHVLTWQKDVAESATQDDALPVAKDMISRGSLASTSSRSKSRTQAALDLATTAPRSVRSVGQGGSESEMAPTRSEIPGKMILGTAIGAAAGAALLFAMSRAESENARDEAEHLAYTSSRERKSRSSFDTRVPQAPRVETLPSSIASAPKKETRQFHRNYSTTESAYSRAQPQQESKAIRMIEATSSHRNRHDDDIQELMSRYDGARAMPTRSRTIDEVQQAPVVSRSTRSQVPSGHSMKRAVTIPVIDDYIDRPNYYIEPPPPQSSVSRRSSNQNGAAHRTSSSHHSSHLSRDEKLQRHDSGISVHSPRSSRHHHHHHHHERESDSSRRSSTSTIKPHRHRHHHEERLQTKYDTVPAFVAARTPRAQSRAPSSCLFPAAISLPPSSHAAPLDPVASKQSWEDFSEEEGEDEGGFTDGDGLGDAKTVLPEDSISCVDLGELRERERRRKSAGRRKREDGGAGRSGSEASTVRPVRRGSRDRERQRDSMVSMPFREKREGRRGVVLV